MAEKHKNEVKRWEYNFNKKYFRLLNSLLYQVAGRGDLQINFKEHSSKATILPAGNF